MQLSNSFFRVLSFLFFSFISYNSLSQTVIWKEDFNANPCASLCLANTYTGTNGAWSVTATGSEGTTPNRWYVSCAENGNAVGTCGSGCTGNGDNTLHICNDPGSPSASFFCPSGDCGALFDAGLMDGSVITDKRAESPKINLSGKSNLHLTFLYMEGGSANDNMTVEYYDGSTWSLLGDPAKTANNCSGDHKGKWTSITYSLPASANNNPNVKIGFRWKNNDDISGDDPSTAIDNIKITTESMQKPMADFSADSLVFCNKGCVKFTDHSTGSPKMWAWTFTGGVVSGTSSNTYVGQNPPKVCYNTKGTFDVQLYVSNDSGQNTLLKKAYITVKECLQVAADFTVDSTDICKGGCVKFTDLSTPPGKITQWAWSFPGGTPASFIGKNPPKVCYASPGSYDVTLFVTDGNSQNTLLKKAYINVSSCQIKPVAKFTASKKEICQNQCIDFTDKSTENPTSWSWSFPGGTPSTSKERNPSHVCFANPGTYKVVLTATNTFGSDTESIKIIVNDCPKPTAKFTASKLKLCYGECIDFTNTSINADSYSWSWNGPREISYASDEFTKANPKNICFDSVGLYHFILTATNDQGFDTSGLWITVDSCPSLDIPSAFSPNGDGRNDVFRIMGSKIASGHIWIYNRWGQLVFESADTRTGWNGRLNNTGEPQEVGVYVFYLEATMNDGTSVKQKGSVTLLK